MDKCLELRSMIMIVWFRATVTRHRLVYWKVYSYFNQLLNCMTDKSFMFPMFASFFKSKTCVGPCLDLVDICVGFSNLLLAAVLMIELICTCLDGGYSWNSLTQAGWTSDNTTDHGQAISISCAALPRSTSDAWGAEWRAAPLPLHPPNLQPSSLKQQGGVRCQRQESKWSKGVRWNECQIYQTP